MKILPGDLSAEVDREDICKPTVGNKSFHEVSNGNGVKVVNFATFKTLTVKNTMFPRCNIHKCYWTSPDFYLWVLHPVAHLSNLVSYDAVNRNKVSIRQLSLFIFSSYSLHVSASTGHLQVRYTIDIYKDYSYYNGSVVRRHTSSCVDIRQVVGFDVTYQLLIRFSAFVRYWRENGSTVIQYSSTAVHRFQESLLFIDEGSIQ
jgi:hypothetical protein